MPEDARISTALPHHPKVKKLRRRLHERGAWALVCLFLWVAENRPDGNLIDMTDEDIELAVGWEYSDEPAGVLVPTLAELGFLDGEPNQRSVHDWAEHNPYAAARPERIMRSREAAKVRWSKATDEQRSAAGKNAAAARWEPFKQSEGNEFVPDACSMRAGGTHDACEPHVACVPPSLPYPSTPKSKTKQGAPANAVALPDWLPVEAWDGFKEMRKRIKSPLTARAEALVLKRLEKYRGEGHDPAVVLDESTRNSWRDIFPPRTEKATREPAVAKATKDKAHTRDYREGVAATPEGSFRL
jgi:hypothetical protein